VTHSSPVLALAGIVHTESCGNLRPMNDSRIASICRFLEQLVTVNAEAERFERLLPPSSLRDAVIKERRLTARHYTQHIKTMLK
jgi:hypothetical protein